MDSGEQRFYIPPPQCYEYGRRWRKRSQMRECAMSLSVKNLGENRGTAKDDGLSARTASLLSVGALDPDRMTEENT